MIEVDKSKRRKISSTGVQKNTPKKEKNQGW